jgi:hypothetical protein
MQTTPRSAHKPAVRTLNLDTLTIRCLTDASAHLADRPERALGARRNTDDYNTCGCR